MIKRFLLVILMNFCLITNVECSFDDMPLIDAAKEKMKTSDVLVKISCNLDKYNNYKLPAFDSKKSGSDNADAFNNALTAINNDLTKVSDSIKKWSDDNTQLSTIINNIQTDSQTYQTYITALGKCKSGCSKQLYDTIQALNKVFDDEADLMTLLNKYDYANAPTRKDSPYTVGGVQLKYNNEPLVIKELTNWNDDLLTTNVNSLSQMLVDAVNDCNDKIKTVTDDIQKQATDISKQITDELNKEAEASQKKIEIKLKDVTITDFIITGVINITKDEAVVTFIPVVGDEFNKIVLYTSDLFVDDLLGTISGIKEGIDAWETNPIEGVFKIGGAVITTPTRLAEKLILDLYNSCLTSEDKASSCGKEIAQYLPGAIIKSCFSDLKKCGDNVKKDYYGTLHNIGSLGVDAIGIAGDVYTLIIKEAPGDVGTAIDHWFKCEIFPFLNTHSC